MRSAPLLQLNTISDTVVSNRLTDIHTCLDYGLPLDSLEMRRGFHIKT
jgi:hypothetical protein